MKKLVQGAVFLSTLLLGAQVNAKQVNSAAQTHWSIGAGSYAFTITNDNDSSDSFDFTGFNLAAGYAGNNHFQIRASYFSLENDDRPRREDSEGFDVMAYGGVGFSKKGFRGYGGAGLFSDKWSSQGNSESISGIQLGGGLGYNWGPAALDFAVTLRRAAEYEDYMYDSGTYVAVSANATMSYLF
mgnify:CR=1 FL=1